MSEQLTEDQRALVATAIRYGRFPPKLRYVADCARLHQHGWFDLYLVGEEETLMFGLSDQGHAALELGVPLADAKEAMN